MTCQQCGATDAIRVKHLPLPDGSRGHITLSEWAELCGACIRSESVKYTVLIDAAKKHIGSLREDRENALLRQSKL